jgi:acyl-homoserine lactone acylase PvdQ
LLGAALLAAALVAPGPAVAQEPPPSVPDHLRAYAIVPPGQEGGVSALELITGDYGEHYSDQLQTYASLINDDDVTEEELQTYFHSMQFGPGEGAGAPYSPADGVTVYRDALGIPHIYADSLEGASFALGYVSAEDRLFQMDVFRHAAKGTLSEFVGPGENDSFLQMDIATRREGYTDAEVMEVFESFDERFGEVGAQVQAGLKAYTDGINAYIELLNTDFHQNRPVEYEATGNPAPLFPEPWDVTDTLQLVVLQLRVFGETAGGELANAAFYSHLVGKLGPKLGPKVFEDLLNQNDARSETSIARRDANFSTQDLGRVDPRAVAIPDQAVALARRVGKREASRRAILAGLGFKAPASNAIIVSARESKTGNPLQIGAPQVGYAVPSFFMEVDVHAPGVDFRGPAVPGASALIPLGRGADYAWSLTTGFSDAVDVRAEELCDPAGGEPNEDSNAYVFKGECVEMTARTESFTVKPTPTAPSVPRTETRTFYRTVHGPVFARGTVDGKPVAFVKQRFFWMKELDSIVPFYLWNTAIDDVRDFERAAKRFTMSFNSFYVDHRHIGYFHVGFYPQRAKGVHPALPSWGTGRWEWRGRRPFSKQPHIVDPGQGWIVNWNNKPAAGWDSFDGFKWGAVQRVSLLGDKMRHLTRGARKVSLSDLVDVIRESATQDARGVYLGPDMLRWAGRREGAEATALRFVRDWVRAGAHRYNRDGDDRMDDGAALAVFDAWYDRLVHLVFDDELGPEGFELIGAPVSDYSPASGSSFFFDFSSYLANLFDRTGGYARDYCDDLTTTGRESCADMVRRAFTEAFAKVVEAQGPDPAAWTTPAENLSFQAFGAGSVEGIPWQNRGTYNQVVEVLSDA